MQLKVTLRSLQFHSNSFDALKEISSHWSDSPGTKATPPLYKKEHSQTIWPMVERIKGTMWIGQMSIIDYLEI